MIYGNSHYGRKTDDEIFLAESAYFVNVSANPIITNGKFSDSHSFAK